MVKPVDYIPIQSDTIVMRSTMGETQVFRIPPKDRLSAREKQKRAKEVRRFNKLRGR